MSPLHQNAICLYHANELQKLQGYTLECMSACNIYDLQPYCHDVMFYSQPHISQKSINHHITYYLSILFCFVHLCIDSQLPLKQQNMHPN